MLWDAIGRKGMNSTDAAGMLAMPVLNVRRQHIGTLQQCKLLWYNPMHPSLLQIEQLQSSAVLVASIQPPPCVPREQKREPLI